MQVTANDSQMRREKEREREENKCLGQSNNVSEQQSDRGQLRGDKGCSKGECNSCNR